MKAVSDNDLYQFNYLNQSYILKCYQVSGNYRSKRLLEHTKYESKLVEALADSQCKTGKLVKTKNNRGFIRIDKSPAILYSFVLGYIYKYPDPDYPIKEATQALAAFHQYQLNGAFEKAGQLSKAFSFEDIFNTWYPVFNQYRKKYSQDKQLSDAFTKMKKIHATSKQLYGKINSENNAVRVHNHGDVKPENFVISGSSAALIDFQNAFYGLRLFDVIDGAYEFSFGGKPPGKDDFSRFNEFIHSYQTYSGFSQVEQTLLIDIIKICGLIKFIKEVRMIKNSTNKNNLRRTRALAVSEFLKTLD